MSSVKIITSKEAASLITDNSVVGLGGFIGVGVAEEIYIEVENRFIENQSPRNLTLVYAAGNGDGVDRGMNHYAHEGLVKRIIGGHMGLAPKFQPLVVNNKIEAYNLPQGVISQMFRDGAAGKPRTITHVGLGTFVDPDLDGGKLNEITKDEIVEKVTFDGKPYLAYKTQQIDFALLKGSVADENGNISFEKEPLTLEILSIAMNARNSGGKVIVQVEKIVKNGTIDPKLVAIPGILVDYVVVVENPANHMQTFGTQLNEDFYRGDVVHQQSDKTYPLNERKVIARRAAMLLNEDTKVLNYGIGVPEIIANVLQEEGMNDQFTPTLEPGAIGGTAAGGLDFGCSIGPQAIVDQPYMFDFYDGGGIDAAFLGLAQCDGKGNINVSKFGPKIAGCGGFINITQNASQIAFCGTFTAGGLKVQADSGKLEILQEGKARKFLDEVEQVTFSGDVARENKKKVIYITERAVFELLPEGLTLTEIAPGINLEKDILSQMNFRPLIAKDLKLMDSRIFMNEPMGLKDEKPASIRKYAAV
jgi:propionate CoA-transferase